MDLCLFLSSASLPSPGWFGNLYVVSARLELMVHLLPQHLGHLLSITLLLFLNKDVTNPLEIHTLKALVTKGKLRQTHTQ